MIKLPFGTFGWLCAGILFFICLIQRGCVKKIDYSNPATKDTVRIKGDTKLVLKQDTLILPGLVKERIVQAPADADSGAIVMEYLDRLKTYTDTVKANDVVVAITDSMPNDSTVHRRVYIANKRDKLTVNPVSAEKFKLFIGFNMGVNLKLSGAAAGPSLVFLTKKEDMFMLNYDFVNQVPSFGMAWKLHFGK